MAGRRPNPLIPPAPARPRISRQRLGVVALAAIGAVAVVMLLTTQRHPRLDVRTPIAPPIPEDSAQGPALNIREELRLPSSYSQISLQPPAPSPAPPLTAAPAMTLPSVSTTPVSTPPVSGTKATENPFVPRRPDPPIPVQPPPGTQARGTTGTPARTTPVQTSEAKKGPSIWLFADFSPAQSRMQGPPFPTPKDEDEEERQGQRKNSKLFPKAVWERPADPTKVLYADQLIPGQLMQNINTDIPGRMVIQVSEDVGDVFFQGQVLLPQYTKILAEQTGKPAYGQERIPIKVLRARFPDGTALDLSQASAGDSAGATGLPGDVDNHWGKVIAGTAITAILQIGVRAPFGSTESFNPSLHQEYAQSVAGGLGRAGTRAVEREFAVQPTIKAKHGDPVIIMLDQNLSFQTAPVIIAK